MNYIEEVFQKLSPQPERPQLHPKGGTDIKTLRGQTDRAAMEQPDTEIINKGCAEYGTGRRFYACTAIELALIAAISS